MGYQCLYFFFFRRFREREAPIKIKRVRKAQPPKGKCLKTCEMGCGETNVFRNIEMLTRQCQGKNPKKINKRPDENISSNVNLKEKRK